MVLPLATLNGVENMKKNFVAFLIGCILLFVIFSSISVNSEPISPSPLKAPKSGLYNFIPPIINYFKYGIFRSSTEILRDWSDKSFTNTTLMIIGSGIGFRPNLNCTIWIYSHVPCPGKVHVYLDGEFYDTIYAHWPGGPMSRRVYDLHYYEKGFHRLTFIAGDNSSSVNMDVLVGFKGFLTNILPYLL